MTEPVILKTDDKPSYFNKEMAIGALLGASTANPSLFAMGTVIGAFIGENRMEREKEYGKIIDVKTSSSKDALLGAIVGGQVVGGISALALRTADIPNLSIGQKALFAAAGLTGMAIGAYAGTEHGIKTYEKEYVKATSQQQERQEGRCKEKAVESEDVCTNTPTKTHSEIILAEREQPSPFQFR